MDLIWTDKDGVDVGVILHYNLDNEISIEGKNCSFVLELPIDTDILNNCGFIYLDDTEYGGIIDSQTIDTAKKVMSLSGRTWRGILYSKIVEPSENESHYIVTGDVNAVLAEIIAKLSLTDLFEADPEPFGVDVFYQFDRYTDGYTGIVKMLASLDLKLMLRWTGGKVRIYAEEIERFDDTNAITSDLFDFQITSARNSVNHMIGLGSGELEERMIVHKYIQADGTIGDVQHYFGVKEYVAVYELSNASSIEELEKGTIEALEEESLENQIQINSYNLECDLGDKFTAHDIYTGISVEQYVTNKIVVISDSIAKISYKVGAL